MTEQLRCGYCRTLSDKDNYRLIAVEKEKKVYRCPVCGHAGTDYEVFE